MEYLFKWRTFRGCTAIVTVQMSYYIWDKLRRNQFEEPEQKDIKILQVCVEPVTDIYFESIWVQTEKVMEAIRVHFEKDFDHLVEEICEAIDGDNNDK
jgi:hypothetical protein